MPAFASSLATMRRSMLGAWLAVAYALAVLAAGLAPQAAMAHPVLEGAWLCSGLAAPGSDTPAAPVQADHCKGCPASPAMAVPPAVPQPMRGAPRASGCAGPAAAARHPAGRRLRPAAIACAPSRLTARVSKNHLMPRPVSGRIALQAVQIRPFRFRILLMNTPLRALAAVALLLTSTASFAHDYKVGPLKIGHPWSRATPAGAKVGGGYLSIENTGTTPDRLVSVACPSPAPRSTRWRSPTAS